MIIRFFTSNPIFYYIRDGRPKLEDPRLSEGSEVPVTFQSPVKNYIELPYGSYHCVNTYNLYDYPQ